MLVFVVLHMGGNMVAFAGSGAFNAYARSLREVGAPVLGEETLLWVARVVLVAALALHLAAHLAIMNEPSGDPWQLPTRDRESFADSPPYVGMPPWYATLPVAWLQATGVLIAVFVAFHIAQLTIGATHPAFVPGDPYRNLVVALGFWPVSIAYILAAVAVGAHLLPGTWSAMRSLGLMRPGTEALAAALSASIPLMVTFGMAAVPFAVLLGVLS